ncbi:ATP-binding cassette, subfamily B, MsbA [Phorcysia thermohydrogeniphila]|uniref:ATP-binding cassette, subfamily B, MsbA n=1 Tax=Phorcysia thermohydrogeniphila TaxID=936138 RepID=A0A4R1GHP2_9BACT|nr:ATP-binding cassette, subfamily B, MsbA [Phorcysia thermohydrogeniphila]
MKGYKLLLFAAVVSMLVNAGVTSYLAYFVKNIVNSVFVNKDQEMIKLIPFILVALVLLKGIAFFINYYTMSYLGQVVITKLREDLYDKVLRLPMERFLLEPPGTLISKIINDTNLLQDFTSRQVATFLRNLLTALGLIAVVFYQDFKLAFFGLVALPLIGYLISRIGKKIKKYTGRMQDRLAVVTGHLFEGIKNIKEIKLLSIEGKFSALFKKDNAKYFKEFMKIKKVEGIYPPVVEFVAALIVGFLIFYGGMRIVKGELTAGAFFSFIIALIMAYEPVRKLGQNYNKIQQSIAVAERVKEILDLPDEYSLKSGKEELKAQIRQLEFRNVWFKYPNSESFTLKDVSLSFESGKKYAIVGKTGSGKSTLISLIPRFYDPEKGELLVNGKNIKNFTLRSLRKRIGVVSQDIVIFRGTIKENIAVGKPSASFEEIVEAAKVACIHDFIVSLPEGYDTVIGDGGIQLSGGQKQRIAIARAILKDPDVLILDEATSALDSETEAAVQRALDEKFKDRILIAIAHRLSTVVNSDRIVFLKEGKVVGIGKHEELYENLSDYRKLCDIQFSI